VLSTNKIETISSHEFRIIGLGIHKMTPFDTPGETRGGNGFGGGGGMEISKESFRK